MTVTYDRFGSLVADYHQTTLCCPTQFEGTLKDGRVFYFRYRWGWATLGFGPSVDAAVADSDNRELQMGDDLDGHMDDGQFRDAFVKLERLQ